jgi:hypothetical protein
MQQPALHNNLLLSFQKQIVLNNLRNYSPDDAILLEQIFSVYVTKLLMLSCENESRKKDSEAAKEADKYRIIAKDQCETNTELRKENKQRREENEQLCEENKQRRIANQQLCEENEQLRKTYKQLHEENERLKIDLAGLQNNIWRVLHVSGDVLVAVGPTYYPKNQ